MKVTVHVMTCALAVALFHPAPVAAQTAPESSLSSDAIPQGPPIKLLKVWDTISPYPNDDSSDVMLGLAFQNVSDKVIIAVKLRVGYFDAFDSIVGEHTLYACGKFSPNVVITPRNTSLTDRALWIPAAADFEDTTLENRWLVETLEGNKVATFKYEVLAVRFVDGKVWTNPRVRD